MPGFAPGNVELMAIAAPCRVGWERPVPGRSGRTHSRLCGVRGVWLCSLMCRSRWGTGLA